MRATLLACVLGVAAVPIAAVADQRGLAFSLGVRASEPGVVVPPGHEACQRDIEVEESFGAVTVLPAAFYHPVPRLELRVLDRASRRPIASGTLPDGRPENRRTTIRLSPAVPKGRRVDVCFRNAGAWRVALFSGPPGDNEPSFGTFDGRFVPADILIDFVRSKPRSALSLVPEIFRRAALFHPRWVGAWTFWVLAGVLVLVVPAVLARSVRAALQGEPPGKSAPE